MSVTNSFYWAATCRTTYASRRELTLNAGIRYDYISVDRTFQSPLELQLRRRRAPRQRTPVVGGSCSPAPAARPRRLGRDLEHTSPPPRLRLQPQTTAPWRARYGLFYAQMKRGGFNSERRPLRLRLQQPISSAASTRSPLPLGAGEPVPQCFCNAAGSSLGIDSRPDISSPTAQRPSLQPAVEHGRAAPTPGNLVLMWLLFFPATAASS